MRLLYLDEAGSDLRANFLCVAGPLVHGDVQWPKIDQRIVALIEKYIPPSDHIGFYFHATDIYHGSGYFDRRKPEWTDEKRRHEILCELADIISQLSLPIVWGQYEKNGFGAGVVPNLLGPLQKQNLIHSTAALDCLMRADRWLAKNSPEELVTVVHEDGTPAKQIIKRVVRATGHKELLDQFEMQKETREFFHLPLEHVIDTVHFAEKSDARPLQLADLCAFSMARLINKRHIPGYVAFVLSQQMRLVPSFGVLAAD